MGPHTSCQGESGGEISLQVLHGLDVLQKLGIDRLLNVLGLGSPFVSGFLALLGLLGPGFGGVLQLVLGEGDLLLEVSVVDIAGDSGNGDLGGSGNDIGGVDSLERDSVDAVGSSDQEVSGLEGLEDDHSPSSVGAGEEDDNAASFDALAASEGLGLVSFALVMSLLVISGIPGFVGVSKFALGGTSVDYVSFNMY